MKKIALLICGFACYSTPVLANKCDWATNTPADDVNYKYLVAKSYSDSSASDAANKAERDIDNQIGRLFGTTLNVQSEFYSDTTTSAGTTRSYESSIGTISLKGLERQKSDVDKESGGWVGCVQYRYSQKEFKQEKQRLANLPKSALSNVIFNESVGDTTCKGTPVEIITTPSKAFVTIDNGKYQGESPIKFGNVCNGNHTLEITKENYSNVNESLIVPTNGKISKTLKRGTKNITIKTTLGNSKILIDGIDYGVEPVSFEAAFGIEHKITAMNSEAVDITKSLYFSKDSDTEYRFDMEKLPSKIDFSAFKKRNPNVKIFIDGKNIDGDITSELSTNIAHYLTFSKDGFVNVEKKITLDGGKTIYYPSQELVFEKENSYTSTNINYNKTTTDKSSFGLETYVGFDIGLSLGKDLVGFNVGMMYEMSYGLLYANFGLELNAQIIMNSEYEEYDNYYCYDCYYNSYEEDFVYIEWAYIELGLNLSKKLSVFGIKTYGMLDIAEYADTISMGRYGLGIRYLSTNNVGVKLSYLTGEAKVPSEYQNVYYDGEKITVNSFKFDLIFRF